MELTKLFKTKWNFLRKEVLKNCIQKAEGTYVLVAFLDTIAPIKSWKILNFIDFFYNFKRRISIEFNLNQIQDLGGPAMVSHPSEVRGC